MRNLLLVLTFTCALFTAACSTKYSTLEPGSDARKTAYHASVDDLMQDLHLGMLRAFPGRNLTLIDGGGIKGYSTWTRVALDTYTQQAIFIPVKAVDDAQQTVDAYAFEVAGSGSSGSGMIRNTSFFKDMKQLLDAKHPVVTIP